jgi:hypothetical protein
MNVKLLSLAATAALFATAALPQAASAANVALTADGASFVSGSSVIPQGTFGLTMNYAVMQSNLLTNTPGAAISNGDTRYIFDHLDPDANIVVNLGQVRQISSIGAIATLPVDGDRYILGPFSADISTDGVNFTPYPGSVIVNGSTANPLMINGPVEGAQYIRYHFGPSPDYFGGGGVAIDQVLANTVPEPSSWALMICGLGLAGAALRRRRSQALA